MTRRELSECLVEDRKRTLGNTRLYHIIFIALTQHAAWVRWKYVKFMRKAAFCESKFLDGQHLYGFPMIWYMLRKNLIGNKLGFEMGGDKQSEKDWLYTTMARLSSMESRRSGSTVLYTGITASVMMG